MKQQPDKIFFDKLNGFTKDAPPMAWERIEAGLKHGKKKFFWLCAAASLSAVAIAGFLLFQSSVSQTDTIADSKSVSEAKPAITQPKGAIKESTEETIIAEKRATQLADAEKSIERKRPSKRQASQVSDSVHPAVTPPVTDTMVLEEMPVEEESVMVHYSEPVQLAFQSPGVKDNVTIVLTADQTKSYLTRKNINPRATSEEKKSSTLKKLLKKASDLKVNQDPFGELRQRKNEILALNFKSDKQRGQKK